MILLPGMRFRHRLSISTDDIFITGIDLDHQILYVRRLGVIDGYVGMANQVSIDGYSFYNLHDFHQIRGLNHVPTR
jgi:hypothetical protein